MKHELLQDFTSLQLAKDIVEERPKLVRFQRVDNLPSCTFDWAAVRRMAVEARDHVVRKSGFSLPKL